MYVSTLADGFTLPANAPATYTYTKATALVNPTMEGYKFLGWYLPNGKKVTSLAAKAYTDDITLTAKWSEN